MKKYPVGTVLHIENGGDGWRLLSGYNVTVIDYDNLIKEEVERVGTAKYYYFFTEGLQERTDDVFFVRCDDAIEELVEDEYWIDEDTDNSIHVEAEYETIFDCGSIWAISLKSPNAKVYEVK